MLLRRLAVALLFVLPAGLASAQLFPRTQDNGPLGAPVYQTPAPAAPVQTPVITNVPRQDQQRAVPVVPVTPVAPAAPVAEPPPEPNEFQDFIAASIGKRLPLFGYDLFRAPTTFAPVDNIPVTPDYIVGPGDELLIRAWGQIDIDYRAVVDRNGMVNIPRVGSVPVTGVRYQDLTNHLRIAISRNFLNFELLVTMGQLRAVQVFVVGAARRPGNYTVSSLSTLVNAVFAAGGPSTRGSMRAIQLKRGNKVVTELDLYDLLLSGDKSRDAALLPGDVIYIPPIGPLAAVTGSVNNPAIFELKRDATLGTLMQYAGGLTTTAQSRKVTVERIDDRKARVVEQFDFDSAAAARPVKDGDLVSVLAILPKFENAVTLRGNVANPLRYPFRAGMRIRDLIPEKEALITPAYYARQNLAVRVEPIAQERLAFDVRRLADEINWDYAVIERQNRNDLSTILLPFNLGKAVLENDPANNLALEAGDIVTVFSKTDVSAPTYRRSIVVRLEGEFNHAGVYQAQPGETLRQLIVRVGGVTPQAYVYGTELTRDSTRRSQEERFRQLVDQLEQDLQRAAATRARNVTSPEDAASLKSEAEAQRAMVQRLRNLRPTGRIVLELQPGANVASLPDIALEDGDRLMIPAVPSMVGVYGSVFLESAFLYRPEKSTSDYISQAGGMRKEADSGSIYVLKADGSVISARNSGSMVGSVGGARLMPGDAIVVPEDYERVSWTKWFKDWTQIFANFGLGIAAISVLKDF